jgi:hypothetical protein
LAADSVYKKNADTLHAAFVDSTKKKIMGHDSLSFMTKADSLRKRGSIPDTTQKQPVMTNKPVLPSADSLRTLKSLAAQELGDIFYSEIVVPDSSFTWYNNALRWGYTNTRSPRILFILAELSRTNPEKKYPAPEEYYSRLDRDFPESACGRSPAIPSKIGVGDENRYCSGILCAIRETD